MKLEGQARPFGLPTLALLALCGCRIPTSSHGARADDIFFDIGTMVEAGGYVYADATEFDIIDEIYDAHRLVILDPERVFGATAPAGQPRADQARAASAIWDSGKMFLWDKLDETTLIATGPPPDATAAVVTLWSLTDPLKPHVARTVTIPDSASYTAGSVTPLSDGNAFVDLYSETEVPPSKGAIVDLRAGVVASVTPRLVCGHTAYVIDARFYCLDASGVIEVYAYSSSGGIGPEVAATPLPSGIGPLYEAPFGTFQAVDTSGPGLVTVGIAQDGSLSVGAEVPFPAWESTPTIVASALPIDATTTLLETSAGIAIYDGQTAPGSFTLLDPGFQGESLATIPTFGRSYFLAGTEIGGIWLFQIAGDQAKAVGSFQRWW